MKRMLLAVVLLTVGAGKPATRPAAPTADEVADLRERITALENYVKVLEEENAGLKRRLGITARPTRGKQKAPDDGQFADAIRHHQLKIGMTLDQVQRVIGREGEEQAQSDVAVAYQWEVDQGTDYAKGHVPDKPTGGQYLLICVFDEHGKLSLFKRRQLDDQSTNNGRIAGGGIPSGH